MTEKTLLAVDDDASVLLYLEAVLTREGYRVLTASGGAEALEVMGSEAPDLLLLDVQMPGMSGLELAERVRARKGAVPVIFLTVRDTREDEVRGLKEGVVDYLSKEILTPERVPILCYRLRNFFAWQENERLRGVLATVVSANHEINNPLAVIQGNAELMQLRGVGEAFPGTGRALDRILEASGQIQRVLRQITGIAGWESTSYLDGIEMLDLGEDSGRVAGGDAGGALW